MTMLFHSEELHEDFLQHEGISLLIYFLNQSDILLTYLASKCFVLLSHFEKNLKYIAIDAIFRKIAKTAFEKTFEKDTRVLKEVMRYFLNLYIHGKKYFVKDGCIL